MDYTKTMSMKAHRKVGELIGKRWEIHRILEGGMGVVYIVYDRESGEPLAAKTIRNEVAVRDPNALERFQQEVRVWIEMERHENIAQAEFVLDSEGELFLFTEYVSGGDLSHWIGTSRLLGNVPQALRFSIQFCDGMMHALARGMKAHRDVKPSNCLITENGKLKITDFGLAKLYDEIAKQATPNDETAEKGAFPPVTAPNITDSNIGIGTWAYMAPEQFLDAKNVDIRADMYSFGIMLFEMLAGQLPFKANRFEQYAVMHRELPPPQLTNCPRFLIDIVQTCLAKTPSRRFHDFGCLRERLAEAYTKVTGQPALCPATGEDLTAWQWSNKGSSLTTLGRYAEAEICHNRALELNSRRGELWVNKGLTLRLMGRTTEALVCYDRALAFNSHDEKALLNKAGALRLSNRAAESLIYYDRVLRKNPQCGFAWSDKAVALQQLGLLDEAFTCHNRAVELEPRDEKTWINMAALLAVMNRHEEAIVCCDNALAINPNVEHAWSNKGICLHGLRHDEDALTCYDCAIALNPKFVDAWFNKGLSLESLNRIDEALDCYNHTLTICPGHAKAWAQKGCIHQARAENHEAIHCYERACQYDPTMLNIMVNKGVALGSLGNHEQELDVYEQVLKRDPTIHLAWYNRGIVLKKLGHHEEAAGCFARVIDLDAGFAAAWFGMGESLANIGRVQGALRSFEQADKLGDPRAAQAIAACLRMI